MTFKWSDIATGNTARTVTIALLILQLVGCVADMGTHQIVLDSLFCMVLSSQKNLEWLLGGAWLIVVFSWVLGLMALSLPRLRPFYWALLVAAPIFFGAQEVLLQRGVLSCDAP